MTETLPGAIVPNPDTVRKALRAVKDPELNLNIIDIGLVYDIEVGESGEVRVRMIIGGKESILATLAAGEFFGEVALFDHGPRSADVVANQDSLLLKISAGAFQRLVGEAPDQAAPFLFAICQTLIARIRADNKRYRDSIAFVRTMEP